jgi:hypothetical protein
MLNWLKKVLVTFVAILTFGTFVPNLHSSSVKTQSSKSNQLENSVSDVQIEAEAAPITESEQEKKSEAEKEQKSEPDTQAPLSWQEMAATLSDEGELRHQLMKYTVLQAEKQGFKKFGPTIAGQVGEEYRDNILPKVGQVMKTITTDLDGDTLRHLEISDGPSGGFGERIFHVSDTRNKEDLVRFHVRRDHPPLDGYWFNFHYHLPSDHFQGHYDLGQIYWDKDTPPQWKA